MPKHKEKKYDQKLMLKDVDEYIELRKLIQNQDKTNAADFNMAIIDSQKIYSEWHHFPPFIEALRKKCEHDFRYTHADQKPYDEGGSYFLDMECDICGLKDREKYSFEGMEADN